ncbi:MAG: leucine-rich repeat domain-containing protein, partial [Clostridia bacterium]|nr:leucine-rich repeat domain-containing protein [Clostridia bacterium]
NLLYNLKKYGGTVVTLTLDEIFANKNIVGDTLIIPKEVKVLYKDFGTRLQTTDIRHIKFEENSNFLSFCAYACCENEKIETLDLSNCNSFFSFENLAFYRCRNLREIILPQNCTLEKIGEFAFAETGLRSLCFSNTNLKTICTHAFARCLNLKTLDLHDCKKLSQLKKGALSEVDLDVLDLSGCSSIKHIEHSRCNTKLAKLSIDILGDFSENDDFSYQLYFSNFFPFDTKIQLMGKKGVEAEFISTDDNLGYLEIPKTAIWKFAKDVNPNANPEILPFIVDFLFDKKDYKNLMHPTSQKYYDAINKQLEIEDSICEVFTVNAMYKLGGLGIKNEHYSKSEKPDKGIEISYRNLLAKNYLKFHPDSLLEKINDGEKYNIAYQRTINKIARNMPINTLVGEFLLNNIATHKNGGDLLLAFSEASPRRATDLYFSAFFVQHIDEILNTPELYQEDNEDKNIGIADICNNFADILKNSHKKVVTRSDKNRLTLKDCSFSNVYHNVYAGNELLAQYCGEEHISNQGFEFLQELFERGKEINDYQILTVCKDEPGNLITYEYIEKDNPLGLILGNKTNCCQAFGEFGQDCMTAGATDPCCGFVAFKNNNELIGQSWVWFDPSTHTLALDNIEVPEICKDVIKENEGAVIDCILRLAKNFKHSMEENGNKIENIIIGAHATDIPYLEKYFKLEFDLGKLLYCPIIVGEKKCYSDIDRAGQFIVMRDGKFMKIANKKSLPSKIKKTNEIVENNVREFGE